MKKGILVFVSLFFVACTSSVDPSLYNGVLPDDAHIKGNKYAQVTITAYENFVCSACLIWQKTIFAPLLEEMGSEVAFAFVHYPFGLHGFSDAEVMKFHVGSECAADQNKFWEFHDAIFAHQEDEDFGPDKLEAYAAEVSLDTAAFNTCVFEGRHEDQIREHLNRAKALRISSTPTVFVNDKKFEIDDSGVSAIDQIKKAIAEAR